MNELNSFVPIELAKESLELTPPIDNFSLLVAARHATDGIIHINMLSFFLWGRLADTFYRSVTVFRKITSPCDEVFPKSKATFD